MSLYLRPLLYRTFGMVLLISLALMTVAEASPARNLVMGSTPPSALPTGEETRPEVLVLRVYFRDHAERDRLANELGAAEVATTGGFLTLYSDWATYNQLLRRGIRVEIDQEQTEEANPTTAIPNPFYGGYKTTQEIEAFLDQKVAAYPTLVEKLDIGDSWCKTHPGQCTQPNTWNGYDLWVLRITNRDMPGSKPVYWFDAGIHPVEISTPEVAMRYINWLLDGYNSNPDAHWLVDHHEIWVMPVLNPDGHHITSSGGGSPYSQRKNADLDDGCTTFGSFGTDLNRNFPFLWGCCNGSSGQPCDQMYRGPSAGSEEETQAVIAKIRQIIPDQRGPGNSDPAPITTTGIYQSMHTPAVLNLYSWGWTTQPSPNNADISNIGAHMSALNAGGNGYPPCQPPNCLYGVDGATLDWSYGELGIPGFTTELGGGLWPQYSCLDNPGCGSSRGIWPENRGMLIYQAKIARMPYLLARGPDANIVSSTPMTVTQGTESRLTSTINYAWAGNTYYQNVASAEYYIDTPPWAGGTSFPMIPTDGSYNSPTEVIEAMVSTASLSVGRHLLFVRGRGINNYEGYESWGPISAAFLDVLPASTPTPDTNTPTATATSVPATTTNTPAAPTSTPTTVVTPCAITFSDVPTTNTFYQNIRCLACRGIISGYADGTFRPNNHVTRGQLAKIVSNAAGFTEDPNPQIFDDVSPSNTFYEWINRLSRRGHMSGYACGGVGEPCISGMPYFRPFANATRGQTSKIVSNAAGFTEEPTDRTFEDVPPAHTFYREIQRLASRNIMGGYPCGGPGEPCLSGRPYFRPGNDVTRGQSAKIVANAFYPNCHTP